MMMTPLATTARRALHASAALQPARRAAAHNAALAPPDAASPHHQHHHHHHHPPCPRRVLITGAGLASPLGATLAATLDALATPGATGVRPATTEEGGAVAGASGSPPLRVATLPSPAPPPPFTLPRPGAGRCAARFAELAGWAAAEALTQAAFPMAGGGGEGTGGRQGGGRGGGAAAALRAATGVAAGCALAGLADLASAGASPPPPRLSPYFVPRVLPAMAAGHVSIGAGLGGPTASPASGGSAGLDALGAALALLRSGAATAMVAGGCEGQEAGGAALAGVGAAGKGGVPVGEGAGMLVLETAATRPAALAPAARPLAALLGYGSSSVAGWARDAGAAVPVLPGSPPGPAWAGGGGGGRQGGGGTTEARPLPPLAAAVAAAVAAALADAGVGAPSIGSVITGTGCTAEAAGLLAGLGRPVPAWCPVPALGAGLGAGGAACVALAAGVLGRVGRGGAAPAWWPGGERGARPPLVLVSAPCWLGGTVACVVVGPV